MAFPLRTAAPVIFLHVQNQDSFEGLRPRKVKRWRDRANPRI